MTRLYKFIVTFLIIIMVTGFLYFMLSQIGHEQGPGPLRKIPPVSTTSIVVLDAATREQQNAELKKTMDEYGFPKTWDLTTVGYSSDLITFLYKEGNYTYSIYSRETEGNMPIVKQSSTTKVYTGLRADGFFSPDKHRFAFSVYNPFSTIPGIHDALCIAQIDPKVIQCTQPFDSTETYVRVGGDYDMHYPDGVWVDNSTFTFSVFKKINPNDHSVPEDSQPIRKESFTFKVK